MIKPYRVVGNDNAILFETDNLKMACLDALRRGACVQVMDTRKKRIEYSLTKEAIVFFATSKHW